MTEKAKDFALLVGYASERKVLKKLVISKQFDKQIKKTVLEPRTQSGKLIYVLESYMQDGKKTQKNHDALPLSEIES